MPKVYYGKDSITPDFLQPKDSDTELYRHQIAKDSLRQTEEYSLWKRYRIEAKFYGDGKLDSYSVGAQYTIWE